MEQITAYVPGETTPPVLDLVYSYRTPSGEEDPTGNIRAIVAPMEPDRDAYYEYDELDRLVGATGWWGRLDWTYDRTGNRLSETRLGPGETVPRGSSYAHQAGTSRLASVTDASAGAAEHVLDYDASGNATRYDDLCLIYDQADRLTQVRRLDTPPSSECSTDPCNPTDPRRVERCAPQVVQENTYDHKFRRTKRVEYVDESGNPIEPFCTGFYYDLQDRLIAEHDCSAARSLDPAVNVIAEYVYLEGYDVLAVRRSVAWYWYLNDHLPTPRKLVDASRAVVWDGSMEPFGTTDEVVATVEQPVRFPGQVADAASEVLYNGTRYYVPAVGRLQAPEPRLLPGRSACGSWELSDRPRLARPACFLSGRGAVAPYQYAADDPVSKWDPTGCDVCCFGQLGLYGCWRCPEPEWGMFVWPSPGHCTAFIGLVSWPDAPFTFVGCVDEDWFFEHLRRDIPNWQRQTDIACAGNN